MSEVEVARLAYMNMKVSETISEAKEEEVQTEIDSEKNKMWE